MKNILIICWFLLGSIIIAQAQTIAIKDQETQLPLELVLIIAEESSHYAITNTKGEADITILKGASKIAIRLLGYKMVVMSYAELQNANFAVALETANLSLNEVVVAATRWRQAANEVPSKIIAIQAKEVALQNPQTAADLLNISGKVYIQKSQQGGGSPMIRGFATNRLLYTVDGVRMNTAIFRGGNIQNVISLDPFAIESAEVLFGPSSVVYGSDAIGGVMSFQTLRPQLSSNNQLLVKGKAVTRYSSANHEKTGHIDLNIGGEKWALVSSLTTWGFDDLRQGSHGPEDYLKPYYVKTVNGIDEVIAQSDPLLQVPSAYSQVNTMQKLLFKPNEHWDFQYGFHYSQTSAYGRYDRHNRLRNGAPRYAEWDYGPQKWIMNNLSITHNGAGLGYDQMSLRLAQQSFKESRIDRSLNNVERNVQAEQVQAYSANLDFTKSVGEKSHLFYGLEYVTNQVRSTGLLTDISTGERATGPSRYPEATWTSVGAYLNGEFNVSEKATLQAGLRYSRFGLKADFASNADFYPLPFTTANNSKGSVTGSLGGVYRPSETWVLSANMGTAFRAPNVDDMGKIFDAGDGAVIVPNPDLKAEYAYNLDVSIAKIFNDKLKIDITGYYTILENALVRRNFQLNGLDSILYDGALSQVQGIQNAAVAYVYGLQLGLEVKLPIGFSASSDLNCQIGKEELDNGSNSNARHAAPFFGTSRLIYKAKKWNAQLYWAFQAKREFEDLAFEEQGKEEIYAKDAAGKPYAPAWHTLNIKGRYTPSKWLSLGAGIENITDQRYRPYSSGISGAGRNLLFSVEVHF